MSQAPSQRPHVTDNEGNHSEIPVLPSPPSPPPPDLKAFDNRYGQWPWEAVLTAEAAGDGRVHKLWHAACTEMEKAVQNKTEPFIKEGKPTESMLALGDKELRLLSMYLFEPPAERKAFLVTPRKEIQISADMDEKFKVWIDACVDQQNNAADWGIIQTTSSKIKARSSGVRFICEKSLEDRFICCWWAVRVCVFDIKVEWTIYLDMTSDVTAVSFDNIIAAVKKLPKPSVLPKHDDVNSTMQEPFSEQTQVSGGSTAFAGVPSTSCFPTQNEVATTSGQPGSDSYNISIHDTSKESHNGITSSFKVIPTATYQDAPAGNVAGASSPPTEAGTASLNKLLGEDGVSKLSIQGNDSQSPET
ncbi:hypothetical protein QFC21_002492 [Naganishia friedmannii]|uniref:Uncharacterized protein n=1 Tax=Naganishia friedmannii TaxID=89922 RepID=A0ACC2VVD9_9TREE|nr:hypothetical protein QFC21_002492 [Naganishia friedmannii]